MIDPIFKFDSFEKIKSRTNKFSSFFFFFLISICFYRRIIRNIRAQSSKCKINEQRNNVSIEKETEIKSIFLLSSSDSSINQRFVHL